MVIPDWLQVHIKDTCPYCNSPIYNNAALTDRYCTNKYCPGHLAHKIDALAKRFGIKGYGVASAHSDIRIYRVKMHTQMIPIWFRTPPNLYLHEIGEICLVKGHQKRWREYCNGCSSMRQVLRKPNIPAEIRAAAPVLYLTEAYCNVRPPLEGRRINIMMSGSFDGYRSRADFVTEMNRLYGDIVQLVDVGKRKTGVVYLVKEDHATDHEKSAIANAMGIPIVTPRDLKEKLEAYHSYISEGRESLAD